MVSFPLSVWMNSFQQQRRALIPLSHVKLFDRGQSCKFTLWEFQSSWIKSSPPDALVIDIHKFIRSLPNDSPDTPSDGGSSSWTASQHNLIHRYLSFVELNPFRSYSAYSDARLTLKRGTERRGS